MAVFSATIFSSLPPTPAFAYVTDVSRFDEWDSAITDVEQTSGVGPGLGAEYALKYRFFALEYTIVDYEPVEHMRMMSGGLLSSTDTIDVAEADTGCTVTYTAEVRLPGPLRFLDPLLQRALDRNGNSAADGLAVALEGKRVYEQHETIDASV